jgi:hypothetical protein
MNLGLERFLILGCIAVVILEMPQLIGDVQAANHRTEAIGALLVDRATDRSSSEGLPEIVLAPSEINAILNQEESLAATKFAAVDGLLPTHPGL